MTRSGKRGCQFMPHCLDGDIAVVSGLLALILSTNPFLTLPALPTSFGIKQRAAFGAGLGCYAWIIGFPPLAQVVDGHGFFPGGSLYAPEQLFAIGFSCAIIEAGWVFARCKGAWRMRIFGPPTGKYRHVFLFLKFRYLSPVKACLFHSLRKKTPLFSFIKSGAQY